jgi:hypothetical protein
MTVLTIAHPSPNPPSKRDWILHHHFFLNLYVLTVIFFLAMAASHPHLFQPSVTDESEIRKLTASYFLPDCEVLQ